MRERIRNMSDNEVMNVGRWTIRRENGNTWRVWNPNVAGSDCHAFVSSKETAEFLAKG